MAFYLYFSQGSRTWLALLIPIFAGFSSGHGISLIPISFIFLSTIFLFTLSKRKPIKRTISLPKEAPLDREKHLYKLQENTFFDCSCDDSATETDKREAEEILMGLYSESESMGQCSSVSSEDHSSDMDGSISDEESLIEIAIPSGEFVKDLRWNVKCCKLSQQFMFEKDFWAEIYEMNEEDNLIEIDINIGSIKCSSF